MVMSYQMAPSDDVLETLRVRVAAPLGGRINRHWLVDRGGETLVLRRWDKPGDDIAYELRVLAALAARGLPVATAVDEPAEIGGKTWCLFPFLPGDPASLKDRATELKARGRLLAVFHADLAQLDAIGQRPGWRRCEEILEDSALGRALSERENDRPEEVRVLRWHLDRARERIAAVNPHIRQGMIVHGDFTPWNLRLMNGRLSGILDFELSHRDHRVGDFALSWRGRYDALVHAYAEVSPLEPEEWELLTPVWWAGLIDSGCRHLAEGTHDDGWLIRCLLRRSPLMGPDAEEFQ